MSLTMAISVRYPGRCFGFWFSLWSDLSWYYDAELDGQEVLKSFRSAEEKSSVARYKFTLW